MSAAVAIVAMFLAFLLFIRVPAEPEPGVVLAVSPPPALVEGFPPPLPDRNPHR